MNNIILETILSSPNLGKIKNTPSGWISFNCPACIYNGEPSHDTRSRGGIYVTPSNEIIFNCFRCNFNASWKPGYLLNKKMRLLLKYLNIDSQYINKISFKLWQESFYNLNKVNNNKTLVNLSNNLNYDNKKEEFLQSIFSEFKEIELPYNSKKLIEQIDNFKNDKNFVDVINFLHEKEGDEIFSLYEDFYWTNHPKYNRSLIIPLKFSNKIVGYIIRNIDDTINDKKIKYLVKKPKNYLFNIEKIFDKKRKFLIIVESVFDAIPLDCIAVLGNNLNNEQIKLLNLSEKQIIVCPDRDAGGENLIKIALKNNWKVSLPPNPNLPISYGEIKNKITCFWDSDVKNPCDAYKRYGSIFTLKSIIDMATDDKIKINLYKNFIINK